LANRWSTAPTLLEQTAKPVAIKNLQALLEKFVQRSHQ
jgi:hypothetical protein